MKRRWEPVDLLVMTLVVFLCVFFLVIAGVRAFELGLGMPRSDEVNIEEQRHWAVVLSSLIAIITLYVGARLRARDDDKDDEDDKGDEDKK